MSDEQVLEYRSVAGIAIYRPPIDSQLDNDHDMHNIQRKPVEKLYLLVKKPRQDHAWQFPQGGLKKKGNETVPQGALRELAEECGEDIKVRLIDEDEPFCIYQYPFSIEFIMSKKKKKRYAGAKVQFVRAEWSSGQCQPDGKEIVDFGWMTQEEIRNYVSLEYYDGIKKIVE
ncbi:MAG: hypothetical protein EXX96DRAFT_537664 [Benjaminiella poitrasii]|nr:MAG: hypothetical protein EXX96DRAFT_537664 [Benjaminiella poitrasii]